MGAPAIDDATFVAEFRAIGPAGISRKYKLSLRGVQARRRRLEQRLGRQLIIPRHPQPLHPNLDNHPAIVELEVANGTVIVASDCHYWPGIVTTAHNALLWAIKELKPKAVILNGDVLDGATISRHAPLAWEERPTLIQELEACKERLSEIEKIHRGQKIWTLGNHDCLDDKTECLTARGWLKYTDLEKTDMVLSLDGGMAVWSPINEIVTYPYSGELIRIEKTRLSMAVTPNHRVLLRRMNWRSGQYDIEEYRRADDPPCSFNIPQAGVSGNPDYPLSDDQIALAGWILTDGGYSGSSVSIYQSKPSGIAEISRILNAIGLKYSIYRRQREARAICGRELLAEPLKSAQFFIHADDSRGILEWLPARGRLPEWAHKLSERQFDIFLDAIVAGDGVWDGSNPPGKTCCVIYGKEPILSDLQAVALTHGWRARLAIDARNDPRLCLAKEPKIRVDRPEIFREEYSGAVWCLRVPLTNFMVRRNGTAYFTGNSRYEARLATVAPEYAHVHGVHLKDHFPSWRPAMACLINRHTVIKHRFRGGIHATYNNTLHSGKNIFTGHLHSLLVRPFSDYNGTRFGVDTGTIAEPYGPQSQDYTELNPVNWRSGFAVATFHNHRLLWPELVHVLEPGMIEFRGKMMAI